MKINKFLLVMFTSILLFGGTAYASGYTNEDICKATMSLLMQQKTSIMTAKTEGDEIIITYKRPSDKQTFVNKCNIDNANKKIVWAAMFDYGWGRWRDNRLDPVISYEIMGGNLVIYEDGHSKTFKASDFKRK